MPTVPDPNSVRATGKNAFEVIEGEGIFEQPDLPTLEFETEFETVDEDGNIIIAKGLEILIWHPEVIAAWDAIWQSPWRDEFQPADLAGMHAAMLLLNAFYKSPKAAYLTEFRMWCNEFGLSPSARRKMRITIGPKAVGKKEGKPATKKERERKDPRK